MEQKIKYFSMFTGVGGFELGIERANDNKSFSKKGESKERRNWNVEKQGTLLHIGSIPPFSCVGFSENDKYCNQLLKQKWPDIKNYGDATKLIPKELPDFELLVGGFPCQAFSIAGKRKGFEDTRGTLFHDIVRILEVKRPIYLLLENVKGLLSHDRGRTFAVILASLSKLGYVIQWMVLNSKFFGVPQNRERVFIIGSLRGFRIPEILPFRESNQENNELQGQQTNTLKARYTAIGDGSYIIKSKFNAQEPKMIHRKIRRLTPIECERLQGFPDGWTQGFSDTQRYKMMGNAVTVNVVEAIMRRLI